MSLLFGSMLPDHSFPKTWLAVAILVQFMTSLELCDLLLLYSQVDHGNMCQGQICWHLMRVSGSSLFDLIINFVKVFQSEIALE